MRKGILIGATLIVCAGVVAGVLYGPQLWAGYQFMEVVEQQSKEYEANGGPWPQLQDTCVSCHGQNGDSSNAQYPALAGLSSSYIEDQLHAFASGRRQSPPMTSIARRLEDDQIGMLAAYFERQTRSTNESVTVNTAEIKGAQAIVADKGCTSCHGNKLLGGPTGPRLAGQSEIYLSDQLTAFKIGNRKDPTQAMNGVASLLSNQDIKLLAQYLANANPQDQNEK